MDQGRQGRDQVDTAVVQDVRGQRRAAPASCARLQSWQLSPHACNTGADQGLVADELEGEADQDRREGGEPRTLCRLPNGGGRHPTTNVQGDSAADRGTTAAATTRASVDAPPHIGQGIRHFIEVYDGRILLPHRMEELEVRIVTWSEAPSSTKFFYRLIVV